jgi:hypothetical protein
MRIAPLAAMIWLGAAGAPIVARDVSPELIRRTR